MSEKINLISDEKVMPMLAAIGQLVHDAARAMDAIDPSELPFEKSELLAYVFTDIETVRTIAADFMFFMRENGNELAKEVFSLAKSMGYKEPGEDGAI